MLSASSRRRWFNRGDVTGGICGDFFAGSVSATGIQDLSGSVGMLKTGARKNKPGIQQRVCLLDRLCSGDQRLAGTPVTDVRRATTGTAFQGANHVQIDDNKTRCPEQVEPGRRSEKWA